MRETADAQLLRDYAECGDEHAFRELVTRHTDLVYSAALRQVESSAIAADVAQSVFVDLARKAKSVSQRFTGESSLAGWLHRSTRFAALNSMRDARRRERNERQAMTQLLTYLESAANWEAIRPALDEALDSLGDRDREAILLRFFAQKDFRAVGAALGVSDDAAQKRVSRAVERLREFYVEHGVTVGTRGLAVVISTHAVQAAPAGLAPAISTAALAGATLGASAEVAATNAFAMTTLQKTLVAATVVLAGVEIYTIRYASHLRGRFEVLQRQSAEQIQQLTQERDDAVQRLGEAPAPRLPAPRVQVVTSPSDETSATDLIAGILKGESAPRLTAEQTTKYLDENHRDAASLLAAYRTSGDLTLLNEAMERFPDDPQVAFEAVYAPTTSPAERRTWLDAFKRVAPENALANYLSASDHFKSGRMDQAVQDLIAASGKETFHDYTWDRIQADQEAYRSAGYSEADTRTAATWGLLLPHLGQLRQLGASVVDLAAAYRQTGDEASAQSALELAVRLGERFDGSGSNGKAGVPLVSQISGIRIQQAALKTMDSAAAFGGGTVKERLEQLNEQQKAISTLMKRTTPLHGSMTPEDWINYNDRALMFGEEHAVRWLLNKYGP